MPVCCTVTADVIRPDRRENLAASPRRPGRQKCCGAGQPDPPDRGITILRGSLRRTARWSRRPASIPTCSKAPQGFSTVERAAAGPPSKDGTITKGDAVVIRYEGPKGGPGMRKCSPSPARSRAPASQRRSAAYRRPLLRGTNRPVCWARGAGGGRRRTDSPSCATASGGASDVAAHTLTCWPIRPNSRTAKGFHSPPPRLYTGRTGQVRQARRPPRDRRVAGNYLVGRGAGTHAK